VPEYEPLNLQPERITRNSIKLFDCNQRLLRKYWVGFGKKYEHGLQRSINISCFLIPHILVVAWNKLTVVVSLRKTRSCA
jgi:hypothetical protein